MTSSQATGYLTWPAAPFAFHMHGKDRRNECQAVSQPGARPSPMAVRATPRLRAGWPWLCCALASLAAHALILNLADATPLLKPPFTAAVAAQAGLKPMQVRMVTTASLQTAPGPVERVRLQQDAPDAAAPGFGHTLNEATPAMPRAYETPGSVEAVSTLPRENTYLPRSELTVAPRPIQPVIVASPEEGGTAARRTGILSLFIDESGRVHHIDAEEPRLPPRYEEAARTAFMTAVFTPGEQEGAPVKSRIRIEVVFDNTPLDAP